MVKPHEMTKLVMNHLKHRFGETLGKNGPPGEFDALVRQIAAGAARFGWWFKLFFPCLSGAAQNR